MTSSLKYWIESPTGNTWLKVPEILPFETRMFYAKKTAGYVPDIDSLREKLSPENMDFILLEDHRTGTQMKVRVGNLANIRR